MSQTFGATPGSGNLYYDLRTNQAQTNLQAALDYYRGQLLQVSQGLAEEAHTSILPQVILGNGVQPPALSINSANFYLTNASLAAQQSRAYVPQPFDTDSVFADVDNGIMWCTLIGEDDGDTNDQEGYCYSLTDLGYGPGFWFPPESSEFSETLTSLYNRITVNGQAWNTGLQNFGFSGYTADGSDGFYVLYDDPTYQTPRGYWDLATGNFNSFGGHHEGILAVRSLVGGENARQRATQESATTSGDTITVTQSGNQLNAAFTNPSESNPEDSTDVVTWTSSDPRVVTVSNAPGSIGQLQWIGAGGNATITASYLVTPATTLSGSLAVSNTTTGYALTSVLLSPKNTEYQTNPNAQQFYLTGFYSDGTLQDLTQNSQVQWTASPSTAGQFNQAGVLGVLNFNLNGLTVANSLVTVTASYQGQSDTSQVQLAVP